MVELHLQAASTDMAATKKQRAAWDIAAAVPDPELPVLTIADLGILRSVDVSGPDTRVTITPTYSGCPAMDTIRTDLRAAFTQREWPVPEIVTVLSPARTTDWMSAAGRAKLEAFGIAPPSGRSQVGGNSGPVRLMMQVKCPHCQSLNTRELARFGSTSCKALYVCGDCKEPFDYFKVL